ncbi:gamma-glutamyl-gamma-aminobutyrate hydrolase family protein [Synechococcus sp. H60.2]|uniref:gamma-glutamyl-gamma-aminobutyrate hydrolase family protein n=1 Tax=Synechococcus sp. H60.2 TaxID=2964518 RepID=UPI0039C3FB55
MNRTPSFVNRPLIGVTTPSRNGQGDFVAPGRYVDALRAAGGIPVLFPPGESEPQALLAAVDGLVLTGGGDLCPSTYGEDPQHPQVRHVSAERDRFEMALAAAALAQGIPVLGICRGMQLLNVVSGGKLIPHVPDVYDELDHFNPADRKPVRHSVSLIRSTRLQEIVGVDAISVVSWHHQAVWGVPAGWRLAACSPDELIEAIEHETHPWAIAVQWHPEFTFEEAEHFRLFQAFVQAALQFSPRLASSEAMPQVA